MHRFFLWGAVLTILGGAPTVAAAAPTGSELLLSVNVSRQNHSVAKLKDSYSLRRAAAGRADDMARFNYFSHTSLSGRTYRWWLASAPAKFNKTGENIARGQKSTSAVILGWEASGSHRKNLLDPAFTHAGTAVRKIFYQGRISYLYVVVFGRAAK